MAESRAMSSICVNCLSRLRISTPAPSTRLIPTRSFTTTAPALNVQKKKSVAAPNAKQYGVRERRSAVFKRKPRERPYLPPVGERKAMRKRIVLSNTNAIPLADMQDLSPENMADPEHQSQVLGLPGELLDQLRAVGAFKTNQNWSMFRRPATLIRKDSLELGKMLEEVNTTKDAKSKIHRAILDGPKLSGKSSLLLQAMSMAFLNNWVVINIPEAQDLIIAHSSYRPFSPSGDGQQLYIQPDLTADLLKRISVANKKVLSKLTVAHEHPNLSTPLEKKLTLDRLAEQGASNPQEAAAIFSALWKELTVPAPKQSQPLPPLLVAVDGLNHLMKPSAYRAADFSLIHAHQFTLIRHFLSLLFGQTETKFGPAGGIALGATTNSNKPGVPTLDVTLKQLAARTSTPPIPADSAEFPLPDPYQKLDKRVTEIFDTKVSGTEGSLQYRKVDGLSKSEAKGFLQYFARSGLMREKVTDELVAEKWSLSSGGLVGFVEKAAGRLRT